MGAVSSTPVEESSPLTSDRKKWMGELLAREPEKFGNKKLFQVALPATHNSATYKIEYDIISSLAKCQKHEVITQLNSGVRMIDLRVCDDSSEDTIRISHRFHGVNLSEVLHQIYTFLTENKEEIVILAVKKDWDRELSDEGINKLEQMIKNNFEQYLISYDDLVNCSIKELISSNKRIHIVSGTLCDRLSVSEVESTWNHTNSTEVDGLIEKLNSYRHNLDFQNLKVFDCYLTPSAESITKWSLKNVNWHQLQKDTNYQIMEWLRSKKEQNHNINIVAVDMVNQEIIDFIIGLNPQD